MVQLIRRRFLISILPLLLSCGQDPVDDPIPFAAFPDVVLTLSNYPALLSDGGFLLINDAGFRGIILYRKAIDKFLAFERNCSFQPLDACATVDIHSSTLYMEDTCCGSTFNFEGNRTGGPAWRPLLQYETISNGNSVTITDATVN
jgi:hypothetical protein